MCEALAFVVELDIVHELRGRFPHKVVIMLLVLGVATSHSSRRALPLPSALHFDGFLHDTKRCLAATLVVLVVPRTQPFHDVVRSVLVKDATASEALLQRLLNHWMRGVLLMTLVERSPAMVEAQCKERVIPALVSGTPSQPW